MTQALNSYYMLDKYVYRFIKNRASLLPPGEGQEEGIYIRQLLSFYPLSPTLSRREREFMGQQWQRWLLFIVLL